MPDDYAIAELRRAYGDLFRQQRELEKRVNDLATPVDKRPELAYGQASDWLRMVNTITWTLSSIFLVGAIIAVNGASQSGVDPAWRIAAYVLVFVLCAIWWRVDWIYAQSAIKARAVLDRIAWVRVSIASPHVRPSPNDRRVGIRIRTFEMLWGGGEEIASIVADVNGWSPQCKSRTT